MTAIATSAAEGGYRVISGATALFSLFGSLDIVMLLLLLLLGGFGPFLFRRGNRLLIRGFGLGFFFVIRFGWLP